MIEEAPGGLAFAQRAPNLVFRPDEESSLLAFGVGIGGGIESAGFIGHLTQNVVTGFSRNPGEIGARGDLECFQIGPDQQRIVVEHLFEVGHEPPRIGRVAMKSAADLIVQSSPRHLLQGHGGHLERVDITGAVVVAQEQPHRNVGRKLRGAAHAPVAVVE